MGHDPRIVVALGGNALGNTPQEQIERIDLAARALVEIIEGDNEIIVTHGNGPQIGMIQKAFAIASRADFAVAAMPLPECGAMSQGYIGYHLQQGIQTEIARRGEPWHVATVVTQTAVAADDPSFLKPTKPIGQFFTKAEREELMAKDPGLTLVEDSGRGWRQVVASPTPFRIVERESILNLLDHEYIVICAGGGGIPVIKKGAGYVGVPAVVDKDLAAAVLAQDVSAEVLCLLTAVDQVCLEYGTARQRGLDELSVADAKRYCAERQFAAGSMLPKVRAAIEFVESGPARTALIGSLDRAFDVVKHRSGTLIHA